MSDIVDPSRLRRETIVFKAMSSEARLAIIHTLSVGEKSVNELVEMLEGLACACSVERTNISKHLSVLRDAGIVSCRDEGLKRIYRLDFPCVIDVFECVERVGERGTAKHFPHANSAARRLEWIRSSCMRSR